MGALTILIVLVHVVVSVLAGFLPQEEIPLKYEQGELNQLCAINCLTAHCFLTVDRDCRYYLDCQKSGNGLHGTLVLCSHGTSWSQDTMTCEKFNPSRCEMLCKGSEQKFEHEDENCKTYWECDPNGNAHAKCCGEGHMFDKATKACVPADVNEPDCKKPCVISNQGLCSDPNVQISPVESPNCNIYMDCALSADFPTCCPPGYRFDNDTCVKDPSCKAGCPDGFETNLCPEEQKNYRPNDGYCSTYIKCNGPQLVEKRCCANNMIFDGQLGSCEEASDSNCTNMCPTIVKHDCTIKASPEDRTKYMSGSREMDCPKGLMFNQTTCGCNDRVTNAPDNSCNMELNLTTGVEWINHGSEQTITIDKSGSISDGMPFEGQMTSKVNGYIASIAFFQSQFNKFFIKVVYKIDQFVGKMNLVSNCETPTFALTIEESPLGDVMINLYLETVDSTTGGSEQINQGLKVKTGVYNKFMAAYDGQNLTISNDGGTLTDFVSVPLSGDVAMNGGDGLHLVACKTSDGNLQDPFVGEIALVQFTKCVKDDWLKDMNTQNVDQP